MGMGFGPLAVGAGAQAGLQDLLRQRIMERQMALQEQAQRENSDYRNRALAQDDTQHQDTLALNAAIAGLREQEREQGRVERQADQLATDLPPGMTMPFGPTVQTMQAGGRGDLLRAKPMSMTPTAATPDDQPQMPSAVRGMRIGAPDQMGAKPITGDFAPGQYEKLPTASQKFQMDAAKRAEDAAAATEERFNTSQANMADRFERGLSAAAERRSMLTPSAKASEERRLRNEWKSISSNWRTMKGQVATMEAGMEASRRGDRAAGAQAVLVTFQKILDPTSVVRESEYARSAEGQSILNRIKGAVDKASVGGVGVIVPQLETFYELAKNMVRGAEMELAGTRKLFEDSALEYGINPSRIFVGDNFSPEGREDTVMGEGLGAGASSGADSGRVYYDVNGKPIKR